MKNFFFICLLFSITAIQSQNNKETGWRVLKEKNYSIKYPNNWELDQGGQSGTSFILLSVLENAEDVFRENVNLIIQDLTGKNIDLKKFSEISQDQIKTMMPHAKIIESSTISNKSGEFHKMIYTGDQDKFHLEFEQYYWVLNDHAYILTFTAEQEKFFSYLEVAEKILNSFTLKK